MDHKIIPFDGGRLYRFGTDLGVVWVRVTHGSPPTLDVYEQDAALSARGKTDEDFKASPEAARARNRFGVAMIRPMLRTIQADYPDVREWKVDPVVRRNNTGPRLVEV